MALRASLFSSAICFSAAFSYPSHAQTAPDGNQERAQSRMERSNAMPDTPGTGAYPAVKEMVAELPQHTVYRPSDLSKTPPAKLGVVGWGNGGCAADGASQRFHLSEIASHGYIVIAPGPIASGPGAPARQAAAPSPTPRTTTGAPPAPRTTAQQVWAGVEWALAENKRPQSPLYQKIDPEKIAVAGFSCGGLQALELAEKPQVKAVVVQNSGIYNGAAPMGGTSIGKDQLSKLHTPVIYINGGPTDIAYQNGNDDFKRINHVPAIMLNQDFGHGGTYHEPNGGVVATVVVNWLEWQLRGDEQAGRQFVGTDCGLCNDERWTVERKNFP